MTLMDIVKCGESSKQSINQSIGLFGPTQCQKTGVKGLLETYNNKVNQLKNELIYDINKN